jgi:hypothetical protein
LGLSAILFWLIFTKKNLLKPTILLGLFFLVASLLLISAKIGLFICALALVWFYFDHYAVFQKRISSKKLLLLTAILALGFGLLSLQWILEAGKWDAVLALNSSGWIQEIFKYLPDPFHLPFITIYGLIQPVLPAALVEPSIPFWKTIGIFRSFGWVLLSFLLYSVVFVISAKNKDKNKWAAILVLLIFWIVLSSLRAGGDMWDNPRYRLGLMVPISFLSALSVDYAIQFKDHWLWRILAAEFVFNIFFLHWYISRYTNVWGKLDFPVMIALICLIVAAIMGHGIFYEIHSKKLQKDQ